MKHAPKGTLEGQIVIDASGGGRRLQLFRLFGLSRLHCTPLSSVGTQLQPFLTCATANLIDILRLEWPILGRDRCLGRCVSPGMMRRSFPGPRLGGACQSLLDTSPVTLADSLGDLAAQAALFHPQRGHRDPWRSEEHTSE